MRIEANRRTGQVAGRGSAGRSGDGPEFRPAGVEQEARASSVAPAAPTTGIEAILALQAVGTATEGRKRMVRRGLTLLEILEDMRADLLSGRISPERLDRLAGIVAQAREKADPAVEALLDDIELRVRVELAKHGRYPAF